MFFFSSSSIWVYSCVHVFFAFVAGASVYVLNLYLILVEIFLYVHSFTWSNDFHLSNGIILTFSKLRSAGDLQIKIILNRYLCLPIQRYNGNIYYLQNYYIWYQSCQVYIICSATLSIPGMLFVSSENLISKYHCIANSKIIYIFPLAMVSTACICNCTFVIAESQNSPPDFFKFEEPNLNIF